MSTAKLQQLNQNYYEVTGRKPDYFFCPMILRDEHVDLCIAHIVNKQFDNAKEWTIQRADIDSFYGSVFESHFVLMKYNQDELAEKVIIEGKYHDKVDFSLSLDGEDVGFYSKYGKQSIPKDHTPFTLETEKGNVDFIIKKPSTDLNINTSAEIGVFKDFNSPSTVASLLKSAHLSLFDVIGYSYALSSGGIDIGHNILGKYFLENKDKKNKAENAEIFFKDYNNMFNQIDSSQFVINFKGTIHDKHFLFCRSYYNSRYVFWGIIVFVNTGNTIWAVLLPLLADDESANKYFEFQRNQQEDIEVLVGRYITDKIEVDPNPIEVKWIKTIQN